MTLTDLKEYILGCCNDVVFTYNGVRAGVTSEVSDSIPTYQVWYGDKTKEYQTVDSLLVDKFFGGESISELANKLEFEIV